MPRVRHPGRTSGQPHRTTWSTRRPTTSITCPGSAAGEGEERGDGSRQRCSSRRSSRASNGATTATAATLSSPPPVPRLSLDELLFRKLIEDLLSIGRDHVLGHVEFDADDRDDLGDRPGAVAEFPDPGAHGIEGEVLAAFDIEEHGLAVDDLAGDAFPPLREDHGPDEAHPNHQ